tara:strand:+ start:6003 stop:7568 length:1566 start_codon:yes stop_codon:yes gene_type:complete
VTQISILDTTLRDGAQGEGISFSASDKLKIAKRLDEFGVGYIEGGFPGANPKDIEFFDKTSNMTWKNAKITAFGATRYKNTKCEDDDAVQAVATSGAPAAAIVAKFSEFQVKHILETDLPEGLGMISDTVSYLRNCGMEVIVDAEHFFDGFKANRDYTLAAVKAAEKAGADWIALCDTNGGSLVDEVRDIVATVKSVTSVPIAIHAHNDSGIGVAVSLAAIGAGATQVHGTINGLGERTGNADLCTIIPTLQLKMGCNCVTDPNLGTLTELSHYVSEMANISPNQQQPYVGNSAFAHKAGYHASATAKFEQAYQHVDPSAVGNVQRILVSELAGTASISTRAAQLGLKQSRKSASETARRLKLLESAGYQFEGAEASFELLLRRQSDEYTPPFEPINFFALTETRKGDSPPSEAMVKLLVGKDSYHTAAEGNGPVSALDAALRKAILPSYPELEKVHLVDYKVRILDSEAGTDASTRVLIVASDGNRSWNTVGSSTNVVEASWTALVDSYEYALMLPQSEN